MRASLKNRIEIIELVKALRFNAEKLDNRIERLCAINKKDFWTKSEVEFLKANEIFLRAKLRQQRNKNG